MGYNPFCELFMLYNGSRVAITKYGKQTMSVKQCRKQQRLCCLVRVLVSESDVPHSLQIRFFFPLIFLFYFLLLLLFLESVELLN